MARSRNIKPSTFKNELLGVADPLLTILFASLWCLADREGKLEDRPLRIKAETFPYRDLDVNGYLTELQQLGFIRRYEVDNKPYILVLTFKKHQSPHNTEKPSSLPDPIEKNEQLQILESLTVKSQLKDERLTEAKRPDSFNRIPDLLIPDSNKKKEPKKKETSIPENFTISERVKNWAADKNHKNLDSHLESFISKSKAKGYKYVDWDEAFMGAIRDDWARLKDKQTNHDKHNGFANKDYTKGATPIDEIDWMDKDDRI